MPLSFEAAVAQAMGLTDFERSVNSPGHSAFHLERMTLLAERLGGIHLGIPTVHVAGTKGKGSTSAMITSISLDHVATLGATTEKIAHEKAGIIKQGTPVVIAPQAEPDALDVFRKVSSEKSSPITEVQTSFTWQKDQSDLSGQSFTMEGLGRSYEAWIPLLGDHQIENAVTAVAAINTLVDAGFPVSDDSIMQGLRDVRWAGRLEVMEHEGRTIVIDGAHNPYSVKRLVEALREYVDVQGRVILVYAALGGHSAEGMLVALAPLEPEAIIVRSRHPRSGDTTRAADAAREVGIEVVGLSDTVVGGFDMAIERSAPGDIILCTGSLSVASEVLEELRGIEPEIYPNLRPSTVSKVPQP